MTPPDKQLFSELETFLLREGATFIACGDIRELPAPQRQRMPVGICVGVALTPSIVAGLTTGPTPEYGDLYVRVNHQLQHLADSCARFLVHRGFDAIASKATVDKLDHVTLSTLLPHKTVATLAGVGWVGKCALLVTKAYGSAVRYNTVLTNAPVPTSAPVTESHCHTCRECVDACPGKAPTGREWSRTMKREDFFDAFACCRTAQAQCRERGIPHTVCGICVAVCPHTRAYLKRAGIHA